MISKICLNTNQNIDNDSIKMFSGQNRFPRNAFFKRLWIIVKNVLRRSRFKTSNTTLNAIPLFSLLVEELSISLLLSKNSQFL